MLKGRLGPVINGFKNEMKIHAERIFEKAEIIKKKIEFIENYQSKSVIVTPAFENVDVFTMDKEKDSAYVNYLIMQNGTIIQTKTLKVKLIWMKMTKKSLIFDCPVENNFQQPCQRNSCSIYNRLS